MNTECCAGGLALGNRHSCAYQMQKNMVFNLGKLLTAIRKVTFNHHSEGETKIYYEQYYFFQMFPGYSCILCPSRTTEQ